MRPYPRWLSQWPPLSCWREQWGPAPEPQRGRQHWPCPGSRSVGTRTLRTRGPKKKIVGEQYLCATRSPTMPRPLRARHSRDAARARSHHRNRLRAAPQGRRRHSSSSLHVLRFLGAAPCICACNQIEWLLALSALWDGSAAGGGACGALVGLHPLAPLLRASLGAHAALLVTCCACYQIEWLLAS